MDLFNELINAFSISELEQAKIILNNKIIIDKTDYIKDIFINQIDTNEDMSEQIKEHFLCLVDTIDIKKETTEIIDDLICRKLQFTFNRSIIIITYTGDDKGNGEFDYDIDMLYNIKIPHRIYKNEIDKFVKSIIKWHVENV